MIPHPKVLKDSTLYKRKQIIHHKLPDGCYRQHDVIFLQNHCIKPTIVRRANSDLKEMQGHCFQFKSKLPLDVNINSEENLSELKTAAHN